VTYLKKKKERKKGYRVRREKEKVSKGRKSQWTDWLKTRTDERRERERAEGLSVSEQVKENEKEREREEKDEEESEGE
jgi:hypothetical protein